MFTLNMRYLISGLDPSPIETSCTRGISYGSACALRLDIAVPEPSGRRAARCEGTSSDWKILSPPHVQLALILRHQSRPCSTCQSHNQTSITIPKNPAMQIPPLSLTDVAPRLNSRSSTGTFSMISANVFTYTAPPSNPSQNITANTIYTDGIKFNNACSVSSTKFPTCRKQGRYRW